MEPQTDYDVCATCGSLDICEHDDDDPSLSNSPTIRRDASSASRRPQQEDICEMVSNASIYPGDEVFNSYDTNLPNAKLLCHYGFLLEGNSNDTVSWSDDELDRDTSIRDREIRTILPLLCSITPDLEALQFDLLYDPRALHPKAEGGSPERVSKDVLEPIFGVNAEGLLSSHLFALLFLSRIPGGQSSKGA